ncbi:MAG TPA: type II toxin-antitoxin system RelE/ParE family toxin [Crinalium sp.]|jgi:putative addiction module killer protein
MASQLYELRVYETQKGAVPFTDWLDGLSDQNARARIKKRLDRVALGNLGDYKFVGEGVFELRIDYGPGYRVYCAQSGMLMILLLCGGDKSSQNRDILKAKQFWADFKRRENANE